MLLVREIIKAAGVIAVMCVLLGCQATQTTASYHPANCAMVGSSCSRDR